MKTTILFLLIGFFENKLDPFSSFHNKRLNNGFKSYIFGAPNLSIMYTYLPYEMGNIQSFKEDCRIISDFQIYIIENENSF